MDHRRAELERWMADHLGVARVDTRPVSSDASFRRYFRAHLGTRSVIGMDAPPEREDTRQFIKVAELLREAGLNAPEVLAQDTDAGFLLLNDLGRDSYMDVLNETNADQLMSQALVALIRWQAATEAGVLPDYDAALLQRELDMFPEWYVARHLGSTFTSGQRDSWRHVSSLLVENALRQPQVFVHRDYMPRNLMVCVPNPGILDFQDAVLGPVSYDVVSLFRDAFLSWDEARVRRWRQEYWQRARAAGIPVHSDIDAFVTAFDLMGVQRHLKVIGIFARLYYRDGKSRYLSEIPRFIRYIRNVAPRYEALSPLLGLLDEFEWRDEAGSMAT